MSDCFYCSDEYKKYMKKVAVLPHSRVYLNNEQEYVGRCVVVLKSHKQELFELTPDELHGFMDDVANVANAINSVFNPDKINYAIYGDIDSHIHMHVVPKHKGCKNWGWPFEITAIDTPVKYLNDNEYGKVIEDIRCHLRADSYV